MSRRYRRSKGNDQKYQRLAEEVFDSMKYAFLFSVFLGYSKNKSKSFNDGIPFGPDVVTQEDEFALNALVLAKTKDIRAMIGEPPKGVGTKEATADEDSVEKARNQLIESYANGGVEILYRKLYDESGDPLDNLIDLISQEYEEHDDQLVKKVLGSLLVK